MAGGWRPRLFRIHAWLGLNLGLLLFLVCFTGTVAVFSHELDWLADPVVRVPPPEGEVPPFSWQAVADGVARTYPTATPLRLFAPEGRTWAARAVVAHAPGDLRWVFVDPYSGEVTGQRSMFGLVSFLRIFHKQLYVVPSNLWIHGVLIVGALGIVLVVSLLTGVLSHRRWWRSLFRLRAGRSVRLFWSDLHRMTGSWALVFAMVLGLTGTWYLAEYILEQPW